MNSFRVFYFLIFVILLSVSITSLSGCGQIGSITGGYRDSLPPVLLNATPALQTTNFKGNKITFTFDEYVEATEIQANVLVSPYPKTNPEVNSKLKTVTIKLKDTLLENTTYAINFGKAIKDINEGNVLKDFTYVFSTGSNIDTLSLVGNVALAETGKPDSTLIVMLYRNANDSSVQKTRPNYIAKLSGDGNFKFINLPADNFSIYALKDGDGGKTYNSKTEIFAFFNNTLTISDSIKPINLFAYAEEKIIEKKPTTTTKPKTNTQKTLKYTASAGTEKQDIRKPLQLEFNAPLKNFDYTKIILTDTNYNPINTEPFKLDSNKIIADVKWAADFDYRLIINKNAVADSTDSTLIKTDTLRFKTKAETNYGKVVLRFTNIDLAQHPVLQFVQGEEVKESFAVTANEWNYKLFPPGEYDIRILYDDNNNGKWDPGNYSKKLQPEKVIALPKKLAVKENWDNESDIKL